MSSVLSIQMLVELHIPLATGQKDKGSVMIISSYAN